MILEAGLSTASPHADPERAGGSPATMTPVGGAGAQEERWSAASGFAVLAFSGAALAYERGGPAVDADGGDIARFFRDHRDTLVTQSLLFLLGSAALVWWLAVLRAFLVRSEGAPGRLSALAFGAGLTATALNLIAQAFQLGLALEPGDAVPPALFATGLAVFAIANLPLGIMLAAVAVVVLRYGVLPRWLGWLSAVAAVATVALALTVAVDDGPFASGGALNSLLYLGFVVWLIPTTVLIFRRLRPGPAGDSST